jgi:5-methylcytosine-specific restriction endonuclease McrA
MYRSHTVIRESTNRKHIGARYGRMTIQSVSHRDPKNTHHYFVACLCDCGTKKTVRLSGLQQGSVVSCGCFNRERVKACNAGNTYARLAPGISALHKLFKNYAGEAADRGYSFELSLSEFATLTSGKCFYCDLPPTRVATIKNGHGSYPFNGVDRLDNALGYTLDNCVSACRECNVAKHAVSKEMVRRIYHRLFKEGKA